jgi:hypothetical protein
MVQCRLATGLATGQGFDAWDFITTEVNQNDTTCHQGFALWFGTSATARVLVRTWSRLACLSTPYVWSLQSFGDN